MFEIAWKGGQHAALAESLALQAANGIEATRLTLLIVTHGAPAQAPWVVDPDRGEVSAAEVVRVETAG
jgi:hypothetical protein